MTTSQEGEWDDDHEVLWDENDSEVELWCEADK